MDRSHLNLLYEFITYRGNELPPFHIDIEQAWFGDGLINKELIDKTIWALSGIASCFKHLISNKKIVSYENLINIGPDQRILGIHILLDEFTRHTYFCYMHISIFYRFIYGLTSPTDHKYIIYVVDFEPSNYILSDDMIYANDFALAQMFQCLNNIALMHLIRKDVEHRYDFLKKNESLKALPFELIEMVIGYANH
jgi:hypothetical protein